MGNMMNGIIFGVIFIISMMLFDLYKDMKESLNKNYYTESYIDDSENIYYSHAIKNMDERYFKEEKSYNHIPFKEFYFIYLMRKMNSTLK